MVAIIFISELLFTVWHRYKYTTTLQRLIRRLHY